MPKFKSGDKVTIGDDGDVHTLRYTPGVPLTHPYFIDGGVGRWDDEGRSYDGKRARLYHAKPEDAPTRTGPVIIPTAHSLPPLTAFSKEVLEFSAPGYEALARVLRLAYQQSAEGKGRERHANAQPFHQQPILTNGRVFGDGFTSGQAVKKLQELHGMVLRGEHRAAKHEALGAIVYAAATYLLIEEMENKDHD